MNKEQRKFSEILPFMLIDARESVCCISFFHEQFVLKIDNDCMFLYRKHRSKCTFHVMTYKSLVFLAYHGICELRETFRSKNTSELPLKYNNTLMK